MEHKEFSAATVGASSGGSLSVTFTVVITIMTSTVDVNKGEELLLQISHKKETKRKDGSWRTDVAKGERPPKARAKAKTTVSNLEVVTEI